jgi:hypothetical protein
MTDVDQLHDRHATIAGAIDAAQRKLELARASIPRLTEARRQALVDSDDAAVDQADRELASARASEVRESERVTLLEAELAEVVAAEREQAGREKRAYLQRVFDLHVASLQDYAELATALSERLQHLDAVEQFLMREGGPSLQSFRMTPPRTVEAQYGEERLVPHGPRVLNGKGEDVGGGSPQFTRERSLLHPAQFFPAVVLPDLVTSIVLPPAFPGEPEIWGAATRARARARYPEILESVLASLDDAKAATTALGGSESQSTAASSDAEITLSVDASAASSDAEITLSVDASAAPTLFVDASAALVPADSASSPST